VLGLPIRAIDYDRAVDLIAEAALAGEPLRVSALAVHGVMTGVLDPVHGARLRSFDMLVPDGQPVRWALRVLHGLRLPDRVYGPELTLRLCRRAEQDGIPIFLYGSREETLGRLVAGLHERFPRLQIAGTEPSKFRRLSEKEQDEVSGRIRESGARITFVGLGCPRQEVWAYEHSAALEMPVLAVGAAFDFHAGTLPQAPTWMQNRGLEWLFRLSKEPRRLWRRYLLLNPYFVCLLALQVSGGWTRVSASAVNISEERYG
jgi:exopolysaccharide biosynthesis WecB/TagA/CpsF family protein